MTDAKELTDDDLVTQLLDGIEEIVRRANPHIWEQVLSSLDNADLDEFLMQMTAFADEREGEPDGE